MRITTFLNSLTNIDIEAKKEAMQLTAFRWAVLPVEQIFLRLKIEAQANPQKSAVSSVVDLIRSKGIKGPFEGSAINIAWRASKEIYQRPLQTAITRFYRGVIPDNINKDHFVSNLLAGVTFACVVQTAIGLPLERLFIERTVNGSYKSYFETLKGKSFFNKTANLYTGGQATLIRHSIVWSLFNTFQYASKQLTDKIDPKNQYPNLMFTTSVFLTSTGVVGVGYPLEFLRNRILMEPEILKNGTIKAIQKLALRYGFRHLYTGAAIVWVHNCIQTTYMKAYQDMINNRIDSRKIDK